MSDFFIAVFATLGAVFVLLASIGLVRMPDTYLRISVTTKAATLGIGLILISAAFYFKEASVTTRVMAIILFIILTAPVGAHLIGRASYFIGVKMWHKSVIDELEGKYKKVTHELMSDDENDTHKEPQNENSSKD
ncbi:monovalent cation/H(+) antiporter subunit G [Paucihalobacter ruber]|uniref:Monovalent cation/H(+) antiporter subunit G n=1 Tax=Paucihalobacter ruber TaxID=2567861 RepID=A0A506PLZ7_9FLAO|nr:monovalent cation/H(+) antiporter subunit G [Paucihalobacter ruber]TPV34741.1 monovalent cation/H(+) antiporter subunit G [Paucihalobacter ruber]